MSHRQTRGRILVIHHLSDFVLLTRPRPRPVWGGLRQSRYGGNDCAGRRDRGCELWSCDSDRDPCPGC